jgi:starch phosphorylase
MSNEATPRERRPSTGAPVSHLQGPIGPAGITRPKHKRTFTGFGAGEIKSVEGIFQITFALRSQLV